MNNTTVRRDKATINRQSILTEAFRAKMHRVWHEARSIEVCDTLACQHSWHPA